MIHDFQGVLRDVPAIRERLSWSGTPSWQLIFHRQIADRPRAVIKKKKGANFVEAGVLVATANNLRRGEVYLTDKGKPAERQGRKAMGLTSVKNYDRQASETGILFLTLVGPSKKEGLSNGWKAVTSGCFYPGPGAALAINNMGPAFAPTGKPAAYRYIFA